MRTLKLGLFLLLITFSVSNVNAGFYVNETDNADYRLVGFFDLRERETFIQLTNITSENRTLHIQIFDVENNCNENNFFDVYTPADTHVYDLRDILTNDGNPSGVVLPNDAYGIFTVIVVDESNYEIVGNLRIEDSNGYEYRTNLAGIGIEDAYPDSPPPLTYYINFNTKNGVTLSDIVGIHLDDGETGSPLFEFQAASLNDAWINLDVDIYDLNEVPFSCRNIIFACTDQENPLLEGLLEFVNNDNGQGVGNGSASVASFEYGINEAIPHSKGGELLCPGNNISEGFARLSILDWESDSHWNFALFAGLNNGNGRGSMDLAWYTFATNTFNSN